jgi:phosphoglycolate phosphatase
MKYKGVLFDCDGTLADTLGDISASMNTALEKRGFSPLPPEEYASRVGWGIKRLAFLCLPEASRTEALAAELAAEAYAVYCKNPLVYTRPYPGIEDLLAALKQRKIKTAVLTNKPDSVARLVISGLFPKAFFDVIQGEVKGQPRKPAPACAWDIIERLGLVPGEVIFAGDSEIDIETGLNAECFPLGVSWGYRSRETIEKAGARFIVNKPEEILELL